MVNSHAFDGVDIDYEGKMAETRPYFSLFLKELYKAMGNKWVMCTIESRTPLTSRYDTIPKDIEYANDYVAINKYCDRVRIMTYDQAAIDIRLNELEPGPYAPVADLRWVKKVMNLTAQTINKNKLVIGVPTYGYEYEVTPLSEDGYKYDILWSFNPGYALNLAPQFGVTPQRGASGELNFLYIPTSTVPTTILPASTTPVGLSNNLIATTSFVETGTGKLAPKPSFRLVWWSDAEAIKSKINLAKSLGVRGVAIFKVDGGEDPALWGVLSK
jgi:spore germination protein YaaH